MPESTNAYLQRFIDAADKPVTSGNLSIQFVQSLAHFGHRLPPWWERNRDYRLGEAWRDEQHLSGMMFAATTKIAAMPFRVVARDPGVASHRDMAAELTHQFSAFSEFGEGISVALERFANDYLGTDNGGFLEIVADGPKASPIEGMPYGVRSLDSRHMYRTNDPIFPIFTYDEKGRKVIYHMSRILTMAQMSTSHRNSNGIGYCAVSRSLRIAEDIWATYRYKGEKMGSRRSNRILVGNHITGTEIIQAMGASVALMEALGMGEHSGTTAIGGDDITVQKIDLNDLAQFDEEKAVSVVMNALAFVWGLEFNEAWPTTGSRASDVVALQRSRSRLPALFVRQFSDLASLRMVPSVLRVELDYDDDQMDQQRALISDINVRAVTRLLDKKAIDAIGARTQLVRVGALGQDEAERMNIREGLLPSGAHVGSLFFDPNYADLLFLPAMVVMGVVDPAMAILQIDANRAGVLAQMAVSGASRNIFRCSSALAALEWLKADYQSRQMIAIQQGNKPEEEETPEDEEVEEEQPEEETDEEEEETDEEADSEGKAKATRQDARQRELAAILLAARKDLQESLMEDADEEDVAQTLESHLTRAWLVNSGAMSLGSEGQSEVDRELDLFDESAAVILARRSKGTDMGPTVERMLAQVSRVYWSGYVAAKMGVEALYTWALGATEKHCGDCLSYSQMGPQTGEFWKALRDSTGHFPQSSALTCTGIYCDCEYEES